MNEQYMEDSYPISPLQQGMLFQDLYAPHSGMYLQQLVCTFHEKLNVTAFKEAWQRVIARHPVLRTSFHWEGLNEPLQRVHKHFNLRWVEEDCLAMPLREQNHLVETYLQNDRQQGFKLTEPPLMRLALFQMGDADYRFIWTSHHAIMDGRSRFILLNEVFSFYEAFNRGKDIKLKHPRPYKDYIDWLTKEDFNKAKDFWRQMIEGVNTHTTVAVDSISHRTSDKTWEEYEKRETRLSDNLTRALQSVAKQHGLTPNTIFQGAWALLWSRYSGEQDVVFGATRACRRSGIKGAESMVGLFINTLPVRISVTPNTQLLPWLKELRSKWIAMRDYEHTPIIEIQKWNDIPAGTLLFESILSFENYDLTSAIQAQGGKWINREFKLIANTNFPIEVTGYLGSELLINIVYNRRRFEDRTIARMLGHIEILLESIVTNPEQRLSDVRMLTDTERRQILVDWNNTSSGYPADRCVHQLFEQQVEQTPDAVAVVYEDEQLTYRELNARANQLAHYLKSFGVRPEVLVGICLERCLEMVIAVLGILKAGGAYVPLDPEYPQERLGFMLRDAEPQVLLTQQQLVPRLPESKVRVVCVDTDWEAIARQCAQNLPCKTTPENLAYVIYTSGSTGQPKGVMISHWGGVNYLSWAAEAYQIAAGRGAPVHSSIGFDLTITSLYTPLIAGKSVELVPEAEEVEGLSAAFKSGDSFSLVKLTPSHLELLKQGLSAEQAAGRTRALIIGGETLLWESLTFWQKHAPGTRLINEYGPTETVVGCCIYEVPSERPVAGSVLIGRPIANTQIYILDQNLGPLPVGVCGELYIGGGGVGRGYLNRPEITAEKFIPDPFSKDPAARLYKTGDLARYLPDGNIEFLGRIDHQVKIRGFRIELGEVEFVFGRHPAVEQTAVIAREDVPGDKRLVAYVVASHEPTPTFSELRSFLKEKLPDYMIPSAFVYLDSLPLTPNGKVDRRALPTPEQSRSEWEAVYVAPQSEVERIIAEVWQQALRIEQVGLHDNFFDLGGHSLLLIQIHQKFQEFFKKEIPIAEMFRYPTIKALADHLTQEENDQEPLQLYSDSIEKLTAGKNRMKQLYKRRQQTKEKR